MTKLIKKFWLVAAVLIITLAILSSLFRALTPWAASYKKEVEQHLSHLLGKTVTIKDMETGWYWFEPMIKLQDIRIVSNRQESLFLDKLSVGINLWRSLWHWQLQPGVLYLDKVELQLYQHKGQWEIKGLAEKSASAQELNPVWVKQLIKWVASQDKLIFNHLSIFFHFEDGTVIPLSELNIEIARSGSYYHLSGQAQLAQTARTEFTLLGEVYFDPDSLNSTQGQIYLKMNRLLLTQWQAFFPKTPFEIKGGKGNAEIWLDLAKGRIANLQARVKLSMLAWSLHNHKSQLIQSIKANLAYKPQPEGWQFQADQIRLRVGTRQWPVNALEISFNQAQQRYAIYIKKILINSLLSTALPWPQELQPLFRFQPKGVLEETQIHLQAGQPTYLLSRFSHLSWPQKGKIPGVENLSGALYWEPEQGHLELDGEQTLLQYRGYPQQLFNLVNTDLEWKKLNQGMRLGINRLAVSTADYTLSASGLVDEVNYTSLGRVNIEADFSGKNVQKYLSYLPLQQIKPRLAEWLSSDIKRIAEGGGHLVFNGAVADFPFDHQEGVFKINAFVQGMDLSITSHWPLMTDIQGYLRVNQRDFSADIIQGHYQSVALDKLNLNIKNIGRDRETLLLDANLQGPAEEIQAFVMHSPLRPHLSVLNLAEMKGPLPVHLRLQVPLYQLPKGILARGELDFLNNSLLIHHPMAKVDLQDLSGTLFFNEHGVSQSDLHARAWDYPLAIELESVQEPRPATLIHLIGEISIADLRKQFKLSILQLVKGSLALKANLALTEDPNDLDKIELSSDLRDLAINLPRPFAKAKGIARPSNLILNFNTRKLINLKFNYSNLFSAHLAYLLNKDQFKFQSGQILLGSKSAILQNQPGLEIAGTVGDLNWTEWQKTLAALPQDSSQTLVLRYLRRINVHLQNPHFLDQDWPHLLLKAKRLADEQWQIYLKQDKIQADLNFSPEEYALTGHVSHLSLNKPDWRSKSQNYSSLNPEQIPNLNLQIDALNVGDYDLGALTLKTKTRPGLWTVDYGRLQSLPYQLTFTAQWAKNAKVNATTVNARAKVKGLSKVLAVFHVEPVVEADHGDIQFKGGWSGSPFNYSPALVNGNLYLYLSDGRVTHLSKETEEKLGLGKLLSILSLQTIPRRLKLDFSDLSDPGYTFDSFKGDFELGKGIMHTEDAYIDGPVAYASMKGKLDLVNKLYDLELNISPHITASLPVVATIAGGPIAGIAAWIASKIINQGMQKISAYSYKVTGPWDEPVVQQLRIVRTKKQGSS